MPEAFRDPLTGLPDRALFLERLDHALLHTERREKEVAVLLPDLDDFKVVNYSLEHGADDGLLVGVAERLRTCCRTGARRLGSAATSSPCCSLR